MCDQDQDQPFVAPGFDANLHDCDQCNDTGISQETAGYCTACRMGKRIEQLDQFAERLKGHGFTEAMRMVFRSTQRTEKAIAAADKALMMARIAKLEKAQQWLPIATAPKEPVYKTGGHSYAEYILATDGGETKRCRWWQHISGGCNFITDGNNGFQPTHWMHIPASPVSKQG